MELKGPKRIQKAYPVLVSHVNDSAEAMKLAGMKDVHFHDSARKCIRRDCHKCNILKEKGKKECLWLSWLIVNVPTSSLDENKVWSPRKKQNVNTYRKNKQLMEEYCYTEDIQVYIHIKNDVVLTFFRLFGMDFDFVSLLMYSQ
jgi:hypothetical protein